MYAEIYLKIEPLRKEVSELEEKRKVNELEYEKILKEVTELQRNLDSMQAEYQQLVQELTKLKDEQQTVSKKVEKSSRLFINLKGELDRWVASSNDFSDRMANLIGDVLISAGVLTYIGFFDHQQRKNLVTDWRISVDQINLKTTQPLSLTEFLSKPQERALWAQQELPNDDLCIENAIIMKRYNRYPLIIDPSD
jgi:dynein heavy chain 1, cytosolic